MDQTTPLFGIVWELILAKVKDPKDLQSAMNTCKEFRRILFPRICEWIFEEVFPLLTFHIYKASALTCRKVCKSWRFGVDKHLENASISPSIPRPYWVHCVDYTFSNLQDKFMIDIDHFNSVMKGHPRSPFIGYQLYFRLNGPYPSPQHDEDHLEKGLKFWQILYTFFEYFGKHIKTITFHIFDPFRCHPRNLKIFDFFTRDIFLLCPNLYSLQIHIVDIDVCGSPGIDMKSLLPPPSLLKLKICRLFSSFRNAMYERVCQLNLKSLEVDESQLFSRFEWPHLKSIGFERLAKMEDFEQLHNLNAAKLEKLALGVDQRKFQDQMLNGLQFLLNLLQNLKTSSPNLETVRFSPLDMWKQGNEILDELEPSLFSPENIKTLEIEDGTQWSDLKWFWKNTRESFTFDKEKIIDYSFLTRFPFLENLEIEHPVIAQSDNYIGDDLLNEIFPDEVVQINKFIFSERMYKSNIWDILPSLKTIRFKDKLYTRERYGLFMKSKAKS